MAKWLTVAETNCADASRESEFNEWYDNIHLPDVLELPGMMRITRYENTEPSSGKAKFLALYEIETDDIGAFIKSVDQLLAEKRAEGRISELAVVVSSVTYRQISSLSK
jgi:hypothetical protein